MKTNVETMRYKVPKVKNRFVQTHIKLIVICALICAVIILLSVSYVIIRQSYLLEPKTTILLFCEVDDIDKAQEQLAKYKDVFNIYFVKYESDLQGEDGTYNLSIFGDDVASKYGTPSSSVLALGLPASGASAKELTFYKASLEEGSVVSADAIDSIVLLVRNLL